jgi:hypothetical protein
VYEGRSSFGLALTDIDGRVSFLNCKGNLFGEISGSTERNACRERTRSLTKS